MKKNDEMFLRSKVEPEVLREVVGSIFSTTRGLLSAKNSYDFHEKKDTFLDNYGSLFQSDDYLESLLHRLEVNVLSPSWKHEGVLPSWKNNDS